MNIQHHCLCVVYKIHIHVVIMDGAALILCSRCGQDYLTLLCSAGTSNSIQFAFSGGHCYSINNCNRNNNQRLLEISSHDLYDKNSC